MRKSIRSSNHRSLANRKNSSDGWRSQAAKVLAQIEAASYKKKGQELDEKSQKELYKKIKERYDEQTTPYYAASRLWVDAIIHPMDTRQIISMGIEASNNAPVEPFNVGVMQT